jgi:hypothetical protein
VVGRFLLNMFFSSNSLPARGIVGLCRASMIALGAAVSLLMLQPAEAASAAAMRGGNVLTISGAGILLNGTPIKIKGLRCSAALISEATTAQLIEQLDHYRGFGVNSISVYVMGSRFSDVKGYRPDASLDPVYSGRLARIIEAADQRGMVVLVGCLYWSTSRAKEDLAHWKQADANRAVANTVRWLKERNYRNVFVDPDNEGMATKETGWSFAGLIDAGHAADPACIIAYNSRGAPPPNADLAIHHSPRIPGKPYVETEGTPTNAPGAYWGTYSKKDGFYNYLNVGVYSEAMKENQKAHTTRFIEQANGYMFASTWLQAAPPLGPNVLPGGDGSEANPGIMWWLEFLRERHGGDSPPQPRS